MKQCVPLFGLAFFAYLFGVSTGPTVARAGVRGLTRVCGALGLVAPAGTVAAPPHTWANGPAAGAPTLVGPFGHSGASCVVCQGCGANSPGGFASAPAPTYASGSTQQGNNP